MSYQPLFRKIPTDDATYEDIKLLQTDFEKFWNIINKKVKTNAEKTLGMRKLQEACVWFCRSLAITNDFKRGTQEKTLTEKCESEDWT